VSSYARLCLREGGIGRFLSPGIDTSAKVIILLSILMETYIVQI
jgi:hypothetical protein